MTSHSDQFSRLSGRQEGSNLHFDAGGIVPDAVVHQAPGCAEEKCRFSDYFEVMSPGLENWRMESGGVPPCPPISSKMAAEMSSSSSQLVDLQALPFKKRPFSSLNDSCVPFIDGLSTGVKPDKREPSESSSEINRKQSYAFKEKLVERIKMHVDPEWEKGCLSKKQYKEIVMKTTTKVIESISKEKFPDTPQKITKYLDVSEKKIFNVIQQYLKKIQLHKAKASKS